MKRIYIFLIATVIIAAAAFFAVENIGYHRIKVEGGTIYGKALGTNKDMAVLLVAGSGPTDMNGNTPLIKGRNDSLIQIAKGLKEKGISSFRYDKRTAGKSNDSFKELIGNFDIFVDDCTAVIRHLKKLGYEKIVVAGHSQGSLVAMLSALNEPVDGYISIGGTGHPIDVTMERQLITASGEDSREVEILRSLRTGKVNTSVGDDDPMFSPINQEFLLSWMKHDPSELIKELNIPILLIQGDADSQAVMDDFEALRAGREDAKYLVIEDMNHVLKKVIDDKQNLESYQDPSYPLHNELIPAMEELIDMVIGQ